MTFLKKDLLETFIISFSIISNVCVLSPSTVFTTKHFVCFRSLHNSFFWGDQQQTITLIDLAFHHGSLNC